MSVLALLPELKFPFAELAICAERELAMRQRIYPNRVLTGRMSRHVADIEIARMAAIGEVLRELAKGERLL